MESIADSQKEFNKAKSYSNNDSVDFKKTQLNTLMEMEQQANKLIKICSKDKKSKVNLPYEVNAAVDAYAKFSQLKQNYISQRLENYF